LVLGGHRNRYGQGVVAIGMPIFDDWTDLELLRELLLRFKR